MELKTDVIYKQTVDSQVGYELWKFTGQTMDGPYGKLYCMESQRYNGGYQWFDDEELNDFTQQND